MSAHRLDVVKLAAAVERVRLARTDQQPAIEQEVSYRQIAREIDVHPSIFTRLRDGFRPDADTLCSLMIWLAQWQDAPVTLTDFTLPGTVRRARRPAAVKPRVTS